MSDTPAFTLSVLNGVWAVLKDGQVMSAAEIVEEFKQLHAAIRLLQAACEAEG